MESIRDSKEERIDCARRRSKDKSPWLMRCQVISKGSEDSRDSIYI